VFEFIKRIWYRMSESDQAEVKQIIEWTMSLVGIATAPGAPITAPTPNDPPEWTATPTPNAWQAGVGGTYDLRNDVVDPEGDTMTFVLSVGAWPTGVSLNSNGVITATSSVAEGTTAGLTITADDGTNSPVSSSSFSIVVPSTSSKRWNPGHYIKCQGQHADPDQVDYVNGIQSKINNDVEDIPEIVGAYFVLAWGAINTTGSTMYWEDLDAIVDNLTSKGKQAILQINWKSFYSSSIGPLVPADLLSQVDTTSRGYWGGVHREATMTRLIACYEAVATRYDNNPNFEMVVTAESVPSWGSVTRPGDYSHAALSTQLQRLYTACDTAFVKSNVMPFINTLGSDGDVLDIMEKAYALGIGIGIPDARTQVQSWDLFQNVDAGGFSAIRDYRGQVAHMTVASNSALDLNTAATINSFCGTAKVTHMAWVTSKSGAGSTWTDIKTEIQANPSLLDTTCPTQYGSCEV